VILALALVGLRWLDVVGMPYIPGEMIRHVQIVDSTLAYVDGQAEGWMQQETRLSEADATALASALNSWARGIPPAFPPTIWKAMLTDPQMTYWIDVFSLPGMSPSCEVQLTALALLPDSGYCTGCAPAQVYTRQEMTLSRTEAMALAGNIQTWLAGNDPDNEIWSKVVTLP
jgi:hypothetical protein